MLKISRSVTLTVLVVLTTFHATQESSSAGIIYSQSLSSPSTSQYGFNSNGANSGYDLSGQNGQEVADIFTLSTANTANQVSWYGTYYDGRVVTTPITFLIRFYTDASGPSTIYSQQSVTVTATDTGLKNISGLEILAYTAPLANVSIGAGNSWISILENDPSIPVIWTWSYSYSGQNKDRTRLGDTGSFVGPYANNQAFTIASVVPEPSSISLALLGLAMMGLGSRRRNRSDS